MPTYYIDKAVKGEPFTNKYGNTMVPYMLTLKNTEGTFEAQVKQRPETEPPSGNIQGKIKPNDRGGNDFYKDKAQQSVEYASGKSPQESARIMRMASWKSASQIYAAQLVAGKVPDGSGVDHIKKIVDFIDMDVLNAGSND